MTLPAIAPAPTDLAAVLAGWHAAERSIFTDENDEWDRRVIDALIDHCIRLGEPFSANDLHRHGLPAVRKALISRRFIAYQRDGRLRRVGYTPSTLNGTKGAVVAVYAPVDAAVSS